MKLGQVMREGGAFDKALKLHESLLARADLTTYERVELLKNLTLDYSDLNRHDQAVKGALEILKLEKRSAWALHQLVTSYRDIGDWEAVGKYLAQWQKAVEQEDTRLLAMCRFRQGYDRKETDPVATIRGHYQQALKIDERFAPAHYFLAESYADEALTYRQELAAAERPTGQVTPKQREEWEEKVTKLYSQAIAHWFAFVESSPADTYMVLPRVEDALFYLQRFDDVEPFLRKVLDKDPGNLDGIAGLADFYVRKGNLEQAEQLLGSITEDDSDNPLIMAIQLKLDYRKDASRNLMPELDHLVDSIRLQANVQINQREDHSSLMNWLDPGNDPLEKLG